MWLGPVVYVLSGALPGHSGGGAAQLKPKFADLVLCNQI